MSIIDVSRYMRSVALELLGEPNARLSSKTELRFGTNGSIAVDLEKGTFYSFEDEKGGGVLDLIARETGRDANGSAVDWLREAGFDVGEASNHVEKIDKPSSKAKIVATYDYVDELGELLFQVVRLEPKTFRQRRKAAAGDDPKKVKDGWVWSVKGIRQVPYRLPDLLEALALDKPVFVVEGEKDVENLAKLGITATCNAMGAGKWTKGLAEHFRGANVIHISDNDEAGRDHTALVAAALNDIAGRQRVLDLSGLPAKGDVSDWIAAGGTADGLWHLVETTAGPWVEKAAALHFGAVWFALFHLNLAEPEYLVYDILTRGDLSLVYGERSSGKSFFATHIAMAVARGVDVFGRRVKRGGVVYIAAEGKKGFKLRLRAYCKEFGIELGTDLPFVLIPSTIDLYAKEGGDIATLLADLRVIAARMAEMGVSIELTVIDTFAAVSPGANENASEDMTRIIRNCQQIQEVTSGHVMIVHHKNAAGDKPRGHTSLGGAVDNAIEVTADEAKNRTASIVKLKDGQDGEQFGFRLQSVELGTRDDGKAITSCVVVPAQVKQRTSGDPTKSLTAQARIALSALREALIDHGEPAPPVYQLGPNARVVRYHYWADRFARMSLSDTGDEPNPDAVKKALQRAGEQLIARRVIGREKPYVWIVREPEGVP